MNKAIGLHNSNKHPNRIKLDNPSNNNKQGSHLKTRIVLLNKTEMANKEGRTKDIIGQGSRDVPIISTKLMLTQQVSRPRTETRDRDGVVWIKNYPLIIIIHFLNFPQVSAVRIPHTLIEHLYWCGSV